VGKNVRVDIPVVGDARNALQGLLKEVSPKPKGPWLEKIDAGRRIIPCAIFRT